VWAWLARVHVPAPAVVPPVRVGHAVCCGSHSGRSSAGGWREWVGTVMGISKEYTLGQKSLEANI
jgi:hypothetical protein